MVAHVLVPAVSKEWGTPKRPNEGGGWGCPLTALADAARTVARLWIPVAAGVATWALVSAVLPAHTTQVTAVTSPIGRLYAAHQCADQPGPGRTVLLIRTPARGAELVPAASSPDGRAAEKDRLTDQSARLYGWCRP